ncbi:MAG TPA: dicarboxylate/amino acid:cation symporter [Planctomycetota bacterium]|nr:dicarboxylate/amino acid:cation symporter [Planctomycetota bacterium]
MRRTLLTPLALLLGLALGFAGGAGEVGFLGRFARLLEPVGRIFLALVQMGVIPLVATAVVLAVARLGDAAGLGRLGGRFLLFLGATLLVAAAVGVAVGSVLLPLVPFSPETVARIREMAGGAPGKAGPPPGFADFLVGLVPDNPIKVASEGTLLPLVVFCVLFGLGLAKVEASRREPLVALLESTLRVVGKIFGWALALAPIGVFALAASATARIGPSVLANLGWFVAVVLIALAVFAAVGLAPAVRFVARVPVGSFERAAFPAQAVAFSTTSSLASLPALLEAAGKGLRLRSGVPDLVLPLAASIYRCGSAVFMAVAALFVARLEGIEPSAGSLALLVPVAALASISVPAVPFGSFAAMAPVVEAVGAPVASMWLLLPVDRIPDMFRTAVNATGSLAAAAALAEREAPGANTERGSTV